MKKSFSKIIILALTALAATCFYSCDKSSNYKSLVAREWTLEKIIHKDSTSEIVVPEGVYIIFSDSNRLHGRAGCNNFFGEYTTLGYNVIGIGPMGSTMMWCPNMDFESAYLNMLEEVEKYEADENNMTLTGINEKFTLHFSPKAISSGN